MWELGALIEGVLLPSFSLLGGIVMAKKSLGLSVQGQRVKKSARAIPDHKIDFSDFPELSEAQLKSMKKVGRPLLGSAPRKMIAVRIDPKVLDELKRTAKRSGKAYQSLINEILGKFVKKKAA